MAFGKLGAMGRGMGHLGALGGPSIPTITDPAVFFTLGQAGAWWDFSSSGTDKGFTGTTGGTAISNTATAGLWIGQKFSGTLANAMSSATNLITAAGWTMTPNAGTATNSPAGTLNLSNGGTGDQSFSSSSGKLYEIAFTPGTASARLLVGTTQGASDILTNTLFGVGAQKAYIVATGNTTWVRFLKDTATAITVSAITVKEVNGQPAKQGTSAFRPTYNTSSLGILDFDGIDDVLGATFPASFTGDVVWLKSDGSVSQLIGQSIGTSYNLPTDDMKHCVIRATLSSLELAELRKWLLSRPFA
jgi:hypothetical protein